MRRLRLAMAWATALLSLRPLLIVHHNVHSSCIIVVTKGERLWQRAVACAAATVAGSLRPITVGKNKSRLGNHRKTDRSRAERADEVDHRNNERDKKEACHGEEQIG
jgi:hypothetical protein